VITADCGKRDPFGFSEFDYVLRILYHVPFYCFHERYIFLKICTFRENSDTVYISVILCDTVYISLMYVVALMHAALCSSSDACGHIGATT